MLSSSTPTLSEFDPRPIPFQFNLIKLIRRQIDYENGTAEILCSGSVGSSKSLVAAHIGITHCLANQNAVLIIGRKTMPSLRDTMISVMQSHLGDEVPYDFNKSRGIFTFPNGSKIVPLSWSDSDFRKVRSYEGSAAIIEELTENDDLEFYHELKLRIGRLSHIKEKFILSLSNPDSPSHEAYKYFIGAPKSNVRVMYSKTRDNIFLPPSYIRTLEETLDEKMKERMLEGKWIEIRQESIYYAYEKEHNFRDTEYIPDNTKPIHLCFDFNIGEGKPMSAIMFQYINNVFHVFAESIIEGSRTDDILEDIDGRGFFKQASMVRVHADATGRHRDTRSKHSDLSIIKDYLSNTKTKDKTYLKFTMDVPLTNPKVRDRHNIVNGQLKNSLGERHVIIYRGAKTVDEGLRLTKLKPGASYVEDDSKHYQHCTTALGYGIVYCLREQNKLVPSMLR